jgi:hypothetical protein
MGLRFFTLRWIYLVAQLVVGMKWTTYLSLGTWVRFPRKAKTPIEKGFGEDREVAVPGSPNARAVTIRIFNLSLEVTFEIATYNWPCETLKIKDISQHI